MGERLPTNIRQLLLKTIEKDIHSSFIIAVYIFGSIVKNQFNKKSDIDIAFLVDEKSYKSDPVTAAAPSYLAAARMGMALERKTDVSILNSASLEMAYEIVTSGLCIFEIDPERRLNYEIAIRGMYFDFKPFLDQIRTNCINAL